MDVRCDKCSTEYEFDEERVGANGVTVKCTACGYVFKVRRPKKAPIPRATTTLGKGPQGREWLVRKPDGQMIAFRELTTLQKWIVEGRINREDEISKNGETWKRLGNILELEPFFSVYEKARALNDLIERGGVQAAPVELRGSEVLAAMNPVSSLPLESSAPRSAGSGSGAMSAQSMQPMAAPPPPPPVSLPPPISAHQPGPTSPMRPQSSNGGNSNWPSSGQHRAHSAPTVPPSPPSHQHMGEPTPPPVAMPGPAEDVIPAARRVSSRPARAAWSDSMMSIPLEDTGSGRSDVVASFERQQRMRRVLLSLAALVVLGGAGGAGVAKFGPQGNPVQVLAARYGLLQPKIQDDGATIPLEQAQHAFDLDSIPSMEKAQALFEQAQGLRPRDPMIPADRALAIITRADQLRRIAADEEALALETEKAPDTGSRPGEAGPPTDASRSHPDPKIDPAKLHQDAAQRTQQASALLQQAFDLAKLGFDLQPDAFEPSRALAEYYRVQLNQDGYAREVARAKASIEKSRATDSALLYIEAAAARTLSKPPNEEQAVRLLEQALTTRPSMNRARVLLARIYLARGGTTDVAKAELDRVLQSAPDHEEAKQLKELALRIDKAKTQPTPAPAPNAQTAPSPVDPVPAPSGDKNAQVDASGLDLKTPQGREKAYNQYMQTGDRQRERDHAKQALAAYEKAADIKPQSAEPLTGMGWAYIDMEKPQAALNVFMRAVRLNDHYVEAYYGEAEAHRLLGHREQAIESYEKYLSRSPTGSDRKAAEKALEGLKNRP
jgi:predicted Zn finger-like uncharacterized protein